MDAHLENTGCTQAQTRGAHKQVHLVALRLRHKA